MRLREIVCCYVSDRLHLPDDMASLRASFIENGFREKELNPDKWLYKRGASLAFEFDYDSEAIEMQVILENTGKELRISVGNWEFPFEPLLMKNRFKRHLTEMANQITAQGRLAVNRDKVADIEKLSKQKNSLAKLVLFAAAVSTAALLVVIGKT